MISAHGSGYYTSQGDSGIRKWEATEIPTSMLYKELRPVLDSAIAHAHKWRRKIVKFAVDNAGAAYTINKGSAKPSECHRLMRELSDLSRKFEFYPVGVWTPREFNTTSDSLSRLQDPAIVLRQLENSMRMSPAKRAYVSQLKSENAT